MGYIHCIFETLLTFPIWKLVLWHHRLINQLKIRSKQWLKKGNQNLQVTIR